MSTREKRLLAIVGVGLLILLGYYFVYKPIITKSEELKTEIGILESDLIQIRAQYDNKDKYVEETEAAINRISQIDDQLPASLDQDRAFKLIFDIEVAFPDVKFVSVAFSDRDLISNSNDKNDETTLSAVRRTVSTSTDLDYSQLKSLLKFINNYEDRTVLNNLNMVLNEETGDVSVTLNMNMYALIGGGREAEEIVFDDVEYGNDVLFDSPNIDWDLLGKEPVNYPSDQQEDLFISLSPIYADGYTHVIGKVIDSGQRSYVQKEENSRLTGSLRIFTEGEDYYATYEIAGSIAERQTFDVETALELVVYASSRGEDDNSGLNLNVYNQTDVPLYVSIKGDDVADPRFVMTVNQGEVIRK